MFVFPTPPSFSASGGGNHLLLFQHRLGFCLSCQRHGKDPYAYMRDVLTRLPKMTNSDNLSALTPANWQPQESKPLVAVG